MLPAINININNTSTLPSLLSSAAPKPNPVTVSQAPPPAAKPPVTNIQPILYTTKVDIPQPTENVKFTQWCATLTVPTVDLKEDESAWIKQYQEYLYRLLETIIPDDEVRQIYVSAENMGTWLQALTHETFNATNNYEIYEIIGDSLAGAAFVKYLFSWNAKIKPSEITSFKSNYLGKGKDFQSKMSVKLKLTSWLLKVGDPDLYNISEDIFESFIGALDRISYNVQDYLRSIGKFDLALKAYAGEVSYRFIVMIFTNIPIDESYGKGSDFTTLGEYASALGTKQKLFDITLGNANNNYYTTIKLNEAGRRLLGKIFRAIGSLHYNQILGESTGEGLQQAKNKAAEQAIKVLSNYGATPEWMRNLRLDSSLKNVIGYDEAIEKAKSQGYKKLYTNFLRSTEANGKITAILQGLSDNDEPVNLVVLDKTPMTDRYKTKSLLLEHYLNQ